LRISRALLTALALVALCGTDATHALAQEYSTQFVLQPNAIAYFDVKSNWGYLLNQDGTYKPFPIGSGMKKKVKYLRQEYYSETPENIWVARQRKIQPDRVNFGVTGRFLRLFDKGTQWSYYGIHSVENKTWPQRASRYFSFGCIIVTEDVLDLIEQAYFMNGESLVVITAKGTDRFVQELAAREQVRLLSV
jgi:hypothetical protein